MDKDMESVLVGCTIYIFLVSMTFSFCVKLQNWTITDIINASLVCSEPSSKEGASFLNHTPARVFNTEIIHSIDRQEIDSRLNDRSLI